MPDILSFTLHAMLLLAPGRDHSVMAQAIADVVLSEPPLFAEDTSKEKTVGVIVAIGFREGSLQPSVVGDCTESKPGEPCKGRPTSFCTMQINESVGGSEWLNENPLLCIQKGLMLLRQSVRACKAHPIAQYASGPGGCENRRAQGISKDRMNLASWLYSRRHFLSFTTFELVHPSVFFGPS